MGLEVKFFDYPLQFKIVERFFMGKLVPLPLEIKDGMAEYTLPVVISHTTPNSGCKVLFAVAHSI